jgi:hypothetical protein
LSLLSKNVVKYFLSFHVTSLDWVKDPLVLCAFESAELIVAEVDKLTVIRKDRRLKLKLSSTYTASLWLSLQQEYSIITKKVIEALLPFSSSCLCEAGFSAVNTTKSKNRSLLHTLGRT